MAGRFTSIIVILSAVINRYKEWNHWPLPDTPDG
jgi:hypothetical protein